MIVLMYILFSTVSISYHIVIKSRRVNLRMYRVLNLSTSSPSIDLIDRSIHRSFCDVKHECSRAVSVVAIRRPVVGGIQAQAAVPTGQQEAQRWHLHPGEGGSYTRYGGRGNGWKEGRRVGVKGWDSGAIVCRYSLSDIYSSHHITRELAEAAAFAGSQCALCW